MSAMKDREHLVDLIEEHFESSGDPLARALMRWMSISDLEDFIEREGIGMVDPDEDEEEDE